MTAPQIELLPLAALTPYAKNARTHSAAQIAQLVASLTEFGFTNPVLIDAQGGIIAGHGRVLAAQQVGLAEVPCLRLGHLTETQKRAYILADNRLALNAGWDEDLLAQELAALAAEEYDTGLTGFEDDEIAELLALAERIGQPEGDQDPDAVPEVAAIPISQPGDLWLLGRHRLLCGDSTQAEAVARLMDGDVADLLLTDPPYNVAYEGATQEKLTIQNDQMGDGAFRQFLRDAFTSADTSMKPGAVFYIWHADSEGYNFRGACRDIGWTVRQALIWEKSSLVLGRQDYHWKHEPCLYGWKDGASHYFAGDRTQTTILKFDKPSRNGEHPTMKPVALFEYLMMNNTRHGAVVLDIFGGSGTSMIVSEKHGRQARLIEIDPKYVDVIIRRWQTFTGQTAIHAVTGQPFPG